MSRDVTLTSIFSDGDDESASLQLGAVGHRPGHLARTGAGLPLLLLLFTFAPPSPPPFPGPRPELPGNRPVEPDPGRDLA
jgi:hypothetical protein